MINIPTIEKLVNTCAVPVTTYIVGSSMVRKTSADN